VISLSGQGQSSVALHTYVSRKNRRHRKLEMPFDNADLTKALSGDVDKTARDLRTPGSATSWLWRVLADELCQGLFLHVCRRNGVRHFPATSKRSSLLSSTQLRTSFAWDVPAKR
jgi:hypothetical protein